VDWLAAELAAQKGGTARAGSKLGLFGASTGAAAALMCAARRPALVGAVVSRGGRPDLAGGMLSSVAAPTLLIVGGNDDVVIELNERAMEMLTCEKRLEIVPGATHLFEEPGALEGVARSAAAWFVAHLGRGGSAVHA
jgi:putative phosphoribosyl transferase